MTLDQFSPPVSAWFEASFEAPTPAQVRGWPAIASGGHTLILAPTGSGKTLAAFLWALDRLAGEPTPPAAERAVLQALRDLVWAGEVMNDTLAPLRALLARRPRASKGKPRPGALRRAGSPAGAGRWSLVAPLLEPAPSPTEIAHAGAPAHRPARHRDT